MTGGLKMIEFDKQISRKDTESVKWDAIAETYQMDDLLPLWVADMDFLSPGGVAKAFSEYIKHGILVMPLCLINYIRLSFIGNANTMLWS